MIAERSMKCSIVAYEYPVSSPAFLLSCEQCEQTNRIFVGQRTRELHPPRLQSRHIVTGRSPDGSSKHSPNWVSELLVFAIVFSTIVRRENPSCAFASSLA